MDLANLAQLMKGGAHELRHRRLEHLNVKHMHALQSSKSVLNLGKVFYHTFSSICKGCIEGRHLKGAFPTMNKANEPLELAHLDLFGHISDILLIADMTSSGNDLEISLSWRNEAPMVVGMAEFSRSPLFDIEEFEEKVGDNLVAIQAPRGGPPNKGCL